MALKEFHKIDLETGIRLDVCLFDDVKEVPTEYKEGWAGRAFYNPVWSFELNDWVDAMPMEYVLDEARKSKDEELNLECKKAILYGFTHTIDGIEYHFSYDAEAQQNFSDAITAFRDGLIKSLGWTVRVNGEYSRIQITPEIMDELKIVILMHKDSHISRYRDELMPLVNEAQTVEEIEQVRWDESR